MRKVFCDGCGQEILPSAKELLVLTGRRTADLTTRVVQTDLKPDLHDWECLRLWDQKMAAAEAAQKAGATP